LPDDLSAQVDVSAWPGSSTEGEAGQQARAQHEDMRPTPRVSVVYPASEAPTPRSFVDVAVGASAEVVDIAVVLAHRAAPVVRPAARLALDPPLVPAALRPGRWLVVLASNGATHRDELAERVGRVLHAVVPAVLEEVLRSADLTRLLPEYVDLDALVAGLDVDAVVSRCDVEAVLDRVDLTRVVLDRVDLDALVQAVLDKIDLAALAEEVIDVVDLPEIIRASTGSLASGTVQGARMQGIAADQTVARIRKRLRMRRSSDASSPPSDGGPAADTPQARPAAR
jgi:hypothetical protein